MMTGVPFAHHLRWRQLNQDTVCIFGSDNMVLYLLKSGFPHLRWSILVNFGSLKGMSNSKSFKIHSRVAGTPRFTLGHLGNMIHSCMEFEELSMAVGKCQAVESWNRGPWRSRFLHYLLSMFIAAYLSWLHHVTSAQISKNIMINEDWTKKVEWLTK
jgi:hypothetical protein